MRIIFATHNQGKLREIRQILSDISSEILAKSALGIDFEPAETGKSFAENAELKAVGIRNYMKEHDLLQPGDVIMADDSGLCIDWLRGAPGIYSARYLGEDTSYEIKNAHIIEKLKYAEGEERAAHFTCNICAAFADGRVFHTEGQFPGQIAKKPGGTNGFGYDPILYLPEYGKTSAELSPEEKNQISHRGKALREMRRLLKSVQENDELMKARSTAPAGRGKKLLVVSDSHRYDENLLSVIEAEKPFDALIHLGDVEGSETRLMYAAGAGVQCCFVAGNNDFFSQLPPEMEVSFCGTRCFLTHGHNYGVGMDVQRLADEARNRNCSVAMFGHTHRPFLKVVNDVVCVNPGSISYPRQSDRRCSYLVISVSPKGDFEFHEKYL